ncbi:MAG: hypothetical protein ACM3WV_06420 [Bacillota bacterium]
MYLDEAEKAIKTCWITGLLVGVITCLMGFKTFIILMDAIILFALTFGIYLNSRTCAVIMLVYSAISKGAYFFGSPSLIFIGLPVLIALIYFNFRGVLGTFAYHRILLNEMPKKIVSKKRGITK